MSATGQMMYAMLVASGLSSAAVVQVIPLIPHPQEPPPVTLATHDDGCTVPARIEMTWRPTEPDLSTITITTEVQE